MANRAMYPAMGNTPYERDINFKFFVDAANPPTLAASPLNNYISSVVRTSQGIYTITLADGYKAFVGVYPELSLNVASGTYAQAGPTTNFGQAESLGLPTIQVFILNSAGAVTDPPAANANVFVSGTIVCCDIASQ